MRTVTSPAGNRRGFFRGAAVWPDALSGRRAATYAAHCAVHYAPWHAVFFSPLCRRNPVRCQSSFRLFQVLRCSGRGRPAWQESFAAGAEAVRSACSIPELWYVQAASCHVLCWRQSGCVRVPPAVMHMPSACQHLQSGTDVFSVIPAMVLPRAPSARAYLRV